MPVFAGFGCGSRQFAFGLDLGLRRDSRLLSKRSSGVILMKPREPVESGQKDMFRSRLDQIIDPGHPLVKLSREMNWVPRLAFRRSLH